MKIGIDARLVPYKRRGWGQYTFNLINALARIDRENQYILFYNFLRKGNKNLVPSFKQANIEEKIYRMPDRIFDLLWNKLHFPPIDIFLGKIDIFHSPFDYLPPVWSGRSIATVHDLTYLKFQDLHRKSYITRRRNALEYILDKAHAIITDSNSVKNDLVKFMGVSGERIKVIYAASNEQFRLIENNSEIENCLKRYKINKNFILYVGAADPDKNLSRLLEAFSLLKRNSAIEHKLVCVGDITWGYENLWHKVEKLDLEDEVIYTGFVPDSDLVLLYNGASVLILPSLDEGFGLPLVEAMACGTPVVASRIDTIIEIVDDAGILFNPYNKDEIAQAIINVLENEELKEELKKKGINRAKLFSWDKTARKILALYEEVAE